MYSTSFSKIHVTLSVANFSYTDGIVTLIKVTLSLEIQCSDVDVSNCIDVDPAVHGTRAVYPTYWIRKHITQARPLMTTLHLVSADRQCAP